MWFDESMRSVYDDGIEPGIADSGYNPLRIDQKPDVDKIDDEIIAEIRRSKFLVADFTHGDEGSRGGVYYEAGFAHGLGLPVIFLCHKDKISDLHFDTRQYHHIDWESPDELRKRLGDRILASIGEGPGNEPAVA
jgi:nucleoside 2-deoxyribosyltransferase